MTPEELFQKTKDMPNKEKQEFIQAFLATADEDDFTQQMLAWGDNMHEQMNKLQQEINTYRARYQTPAWLLEDWINNAVICQMLYGTKDRSTTAYFSLKKKGKRPWKKEELQKLEKIKRSLINRLQSA